MAPQPEELSPYLEQLLAMPFVRQAKVARSKSHKEAAPELVVKLQTPAGSVEYVVEFKSSQLNHALAAELVSQRRRKNLLVFSRYVPPRIADELVERGIQFIDAVGNQHLRIGDRYFVRASGKRPENGTSAEHKSMQPTGYLVYFGLLAEPKLRNESVRAISAAVGVSKSAVSNALSRLEAQKLFIRLRANRNWVDAGALLERWLVGYTEVVRPRLLIGRYRAQESDPIAVEKRIEAGLSGDLWAFGGGAGAHRLTGHYRGESTLVHVSEPPVDLARKLRIVRADKTSGADVILMRAKGPLLLQGIAAHTAHPLLIYTELLCTGDDRAREAAAELRETLLQDLLA